eukprot:9980311-Karenia_brevis.AAC.1
MPGYVSPTKEPVMRRNRRMKKKGRRSEQRIVKRILPNLRKMRGEERQKKRMSKVIPLGAIILSMTMTMTTTKTWEMDLGLEAADKTQDRRQEETLWI